MLKIHLRKKYLSYPYQKTFIISNTKKINVKSQDKIYKMLLPIKMKQFSHHNIALSQLNM